MLIKRKLGKQGLEVSAIGLGCMGMTQSYGTPDDAESAATIDRAIDRVQHRNTESGRTASQEVRQ